MNEAAIKTALYTWASRAMGLPSIHVIDFDIDFVTGNLINGSINGVAWAAVAFDTDQGTTLQALADELWASQKVMKALVTGARQITVYGAINGVDLVFLGPTVTGGASQAVATVTASQNAVLIPIIFGDQNSPRLDYPYGVLRLNSSRKLGWDEVSLPDPISKVVTVSGQRQATVSFHFFGDKPAEGVHSTLMEEIGKARQSLMSEWAYLIFKPARIAINEILPTQNVSAMLETIYEEHAVFDFMIGFSESFEENVGLIEQVAVGGEVDGSIVPDNIIGD